MGGARWRESLGEEHLRTWDGAARILAGDDPISDGFMYTLDVRYSFSAGEPVQIPASLVT